MQIGTALILAGISGAAGLAHQLLWVRRMVDVLGANSGTFSRVIAAFFLGLSLGAWLASRIKTPRPWLAVVVAEIAVALLSSVLLFSGSLGQSWHANPILAGWMPWLLPLLLITPAAIAMGLVIPWMIRAVGPGHGVLLYAVNTLGGIAGLIFTLVWSLPELGILGASLVVIAGNLLVAVFAWMISGRETFLESGPSPALEKNVLRPLGIAFASGFLVLASEVILQHQFAQFFVSSSFSSGIVLTFVLMALGLGALLVPVVSRMGKNALVVILTLAALACLVQPLVLIVQRGGMIYLPYGQTIPSYLVDAFRLGLPSCILILLPAGLVFPLLLKNAGRSGMDAGKLLAINGLGGWCGAEFAERILAPGFGLWWSMAVVASGYGICLLFQPGRLRWVIAPVLAGLIAWSWWIDSRLPFAGLSKQETLVAVAVGREGVVGVVRGEPDDWRMIFNNTYTLGGSRARFNQERQTLLPMLLHGEARRVATLGVATGSSLAGVTLDPVLESAEGIELSPLVLLFAQKHFAPFNRGIFDHPKVRMTQGDARWVIAQRPAAFDVIVGDLFLPWRTGEGRLFTREHFQNVKAALKSEGIYCQWLPMFQLTREQFECIARTFREVFPDAWLLRGDFYSGMPIVALVGGRGVSKVEWEKVARACNRVRNAGECRDPLLRHLEGVAMCVVGNLPELPQGEINTLANAWLEWNAARNLMRPDPAWFTGVPYAEYLRSAHGSSAHLLPETLRSAHQAGEFFHALEIAHTAKLDVAKELARKAQENLPATLRNDFSASWREWPMLHAPVLP